MKTVILAGGFGTRLSEETIKIPKPMVEVGGRPIIWHILNIYAAHELNDFYIACGYKSEILEDYFRGEWAAADNLARSRVTCVDTGLETMTGGRLLRLREQLGGQAFAVTYGDGVGDVDIAGLLEFHRGHGKLATVTAVHPPPRFGALDLDADDRVRVFAEKPLSESGWINGGFFVFEPGVLDYIEDESTPLELAPLSRLAADGELMAFRHHGFWKPMDTLREKNELNALWESGEAPWKMW